VKVGCCVVTKRTSSTATTPLLSSLAWAAIAIATLHRHPASTPQQLAGWLDASGLVTSRAGPGIRAFASCQSLTDTHDDHKNRRTRPLLAARSLSRLHPLLLCALVVRQLQPSTRPLFSAATRPFQIPRYDSRLPTKSPARPLRQPPHPRALCCAVPATQV
jgi:hypothetical protein